MRFFYVVLIDHSVLQCRINTLMPQKLLDLFYWHSLVNGHCCQSPAELMRMNLVKVQLSTNFAETDFDAADLQAVLRLNQGDKQSFGIIRAF